MKEQFDSLRKFLLMNSIGASLWYLLPVKTDNYRGVNQFKCNTVVVFIFFVAKSIPIDL